MALKSSLLWFRRNWRKTSSRFFTSRGPRTIRADFCRDRGRTLSLGHSGVGLESPVAPGHCRPLLLREPGCAALCSSLLRKDRNCRLFYGQMLSSIRSLSS